MIYPKPLKKGDTIGLIGVSGAMRPSTRENVELIADKVKGLGFQVKLDESVGQVYGYLSGPDQVRADAINRMFADPDVDAVYCVRGGYGTLRILDRLDYDLIRKNPKPFIGYSDITSVHIALNMRCGLVTFHGPMPSSDDLSSEADSFSRESLLRALMMESPLGRIENPKGVPLQCIQKGEAEGQLVGGNLTLVAAAMGTPYDLDTKGKILFLEDIGEKFYSLDRMLSKLRLGGKFDDCSGIVLGTFTDCVEEYPEYSLTLEEIIRDVVMPCGKPIVGGLQAGHCSPKITLPLGASCRMDAGSGLLELI